MSLFDSIFNLFSSNTTTTLSNNRMLKGTMIETYELNSASVVDVAKARNIYQNIDNAYKLSAGMVKPIINSDVSFIGEPTSSSEDESTGEELKELNKKRVGFYYAAHRIALREGNYYIWPQWSDKLQDVRWVGFPGDKLKDIIRDPITNEVVQYIFKWNVNYKDVSDNNKQLTITLSIDDELITYRYSGDVPAGYVNESVRNILGEIPIVHLSNEKEDFEVLGHSEITAIEPYLKAYNDVMQMALQSQKNNSAPKLKIRTSDVASFIDTNFGAGTFAAIKAGTQDGVSIQGLELITLGKDDDAGYMQVSSTTGSAIPLLEVLFYLIVETSEVIELIFGANLATSRASTDNQLPVYIKKIERKQSQFEGAWEKLAELTLKLKGFTEISAFEGDIVTHWPIVDFDSAKDKIEVLNKAVATFGNALKGGVLGFEEVHSESKRYFEGIKQDSKEHIKEIEDAAMLLMRFQQDAETQLLEMEGNELNNNG